jgi:transcriptional regulator NrdR family protein
MALRCPKCGKTRNIVVDTRTARDGIRRRRECQVCKYRYTTYETLGEDQAKVLYDLLKTSLANNIRDAIVKSFREIKHR